MFTATSATYKIAALKRRIRAICGGTSAGKTIGILEVLIHMAHTDKTPKLTSIVSESLPHLKLGAMRDFLQIMQEHGYYKEANWSRTEYRYTFETGSVIEFFGADAPAKAHGPRRHRLFVNEANNVPFSSYDQMEVRTSDIIFLDWNPSNEFWFYTDVLPKREKDVEFITLTYKDNESLAPSIVASIESRKGNKNWWKVYGLGELGTAEGNVYQNWAIIDEIPHEAMLWRRGLDFGYTNDPTGLVAIYKYNGGIILDEELYQTGMKNREIIDYVKNLEDWKVLIKADSSEPKSIDELKDGGLTILPAEKGQGSILRGIDKLQGMKVSMTKRSVNLIKEYRNYIWMTDKNGHSINEPIDGYNHLLDAARYALEDFSDAIPKMATFGGGDSVTGYGGSVQVATTIHKGYRPATRSVRTF